MLPREIQFSRTRAPAVDAALRMRARARLAELVDLANKVLGTSMPMPTISFDLRGMTAGQAYLQKHHVRLNAVLLTENEAHYMSDTIVHELAHLAAHARYGARIQAHGTEWRRVMRALGAEPNRVHELDVRRAAVGEVVDFLCACTRAVTLYGRRAKLGRQGRLFCKRCRQTLVVATGRVGDKRPTPAPVPEPAPSPASVQYAQDLARKLGWALSPEVAASREKLTQFLNRAMAARMRMPLEPTERQLAYANALAARRGIPVPADVLASREAMSRWIGEQALVAAQRP